MDFTHRMYCIHTLSKLRREPSMDFTHRMYCIHT